jgi:hydrogenase/urease accessory protein HupE
MTPVTWVSAALLGLATPGILAARASAHEMRPAYLQLHQTSADTYDVLWRVPAKSDGTRLGLEVEWPPGCTDLTSARGVLDGGRLTEYWSVKRAGGLTGGTIGIGGLSATATNVLVRVERLDGTTQAALLSPSSPSFLVEATPGVARVAGAYLRLGIRHILTGADHLLYILAMLFLVKGWKRVVATMSAFTATHSLTLTAAALGWVHVPQAPVEACIALSILFVASEILRAKRGLPAMTARWPWVVSFTFGLLHGFGFAGALSEAGLPQHAIPVALLFFNLGVEVGQILFLALVFAAALSLREIARRTAIPRPAWAWAVPSYAIGGVAAFWFLQRVAGFWVSP